MIISKKALGIVLAIFSFGTVHAHDSIVAVGAVAGTPEMTEGSAGYFSHVVGHGCRDSTGVYSGVIGASVLFPYASTSPAKYTESGAAKTGKLSDHLTTTLHGGVALTGGSFTWPKTSYLTATVSSVTKQVGWKFYGGTSYTSADGIIKDRALVPFYVAAQKFNANSCASQVILHMAAANYCKNSGLPSTGYANIWIPAATNPAIRAQFTGNLEVGDSTGLVVKVNRGTTAYPASCSTDTTKRYTVDVYPSDADIDTYLPTNIPSP